MNRRRTAAGALIAGLLAAAAQVGPGSPAAAATQCSSGDGVSVVVDFNRGAGGGIQSGCVGDGGGRYASQLFPAAGFALEYVRASSFVCKVRSAPGDAQCAVTPPADAYWALFWARPGSSSWIYASYGVSSLRIPPGGAVAFAFQDGGTTNAPGVLPAPRGKPAPTPTRGPTRQPPKPSKPPQPSESPKSPNRTAGPPTPSGPGAEDGPKRRDRETRHAPQTPLGSRSTGPVGADRIRSPGGQPTGNATSDLASTAMAPTGTALSRATGSSSAEPSAQPRAERAASSEVQSEQPGGLPPWVPIAVIAALAGVAGGAVWWRGRA